MPITTPEKTEGFKDAVKYITAFRDLEMAFKLIDTGFNLFNDSRDGNQDYIDREHVGRSYKLEQKALSDIEEIREKYGVDFIDSILGEKSPYNYNNLDYFIGRLNKHHFDLARIVVRSKIKWNMPLR